MNEVLINSTAFIIFNITWNVYWIKHIYKECTIFSRKTKSL